MRRLYKIRKGKKICGVCAGIAEYFDVDPTLIRIAFVIFACSAGSGILAYFIAALVMPYEDEI